jgi:beta-mannosidase
MTPVGPGRRARVEGHEVIPLSDGWTASSDTIGPVQARVPGTAAGALRDAGRWTHGDPRDFDAEEWSFATRFSADPAAPGEEVVLRLDGIATVAEVRLNGRTIVESTSMFVPHEVDVGALLVGENELSVHCRALRTLLAERRKPRARWRTRLVSDGNLRFFRTMLLGRAPGFAPGPAAVGPWRPIVLERRRRIAVDELALRPRVEGGDGELELRARLRTLDGRRLEPLEVELHGASGAHGARLEVQDGVATGRLRVPNAALWWPHTHGEAVLHHVRLRSGDVVVDAGRVGFRSLESRGELEVDGIDLHANGERVFVRGAVWTPVDFVGLAPAVEELRATVECARDAGLNMLRVPGTYAYESDEFYELCDELGVLVWQDFMFANLDYPVAVDEFRRQVEEEARHAIARLAGRPSLAVFCGNSEVEQQVAMLGLDPALGRGELFGELLPRLIREADSDATYVPSAPCGGPLPFRTDQGIANYYGVGAYLRPLDDARRANVRFAAESLAFANVPDEAAYAVHDPRWKAGVPRDSGAGWDFEDVRDHYLRLLFGVEASALRSVDHERYLELSRATTGEVMAEVFGEWRRRASPTRGALVLWLRDLVPGAGWGVLDHDGEPKQAWQHLRRALAPVAVWTTDEGLGGVDVHVANDLPAPLAARLRVALYRDLEQLVDEVSTPIELGPRETAVRNVEELLGRFVDAAWAYHFGPPGHDVIVASLETDDTLLSQAVRFPAGRPTHREPAARLGLDAEARVRPDGRVDVSLRAARLTYGVRVHAPDFRASDDAFCLEPGHRRRLLLSPRSPAAAYTGAQLTALNLVGRIHVSSEASA